MRQKDILEVEKCPHCNDNFGYYTKIYAYGWLRCNRLYEKNAYGERAIENTSMHDSLSYGKRDRTCYCMNCNKPIGKDNSE